MIFRLIWKLDSTASSSWHQIRSNTGQTVSENGMQVIGVIRDTPDWAQKIPPYTCGAIKDTAIPKFASFVKEVIKRYSKPPYNVKHWEIWNEPDIIYSPELGFNSVFGCWGDASQTYYGGVYYGEMLNAIYPAVKAADSKSQVGIGGLLQDCEPNFKPDQFDCKNKGNLLEGIIRSIPDRRGNFDFISFHGYAPNSSATALSLDENSDKWEFRCGIVLGNLDYIRYVLGQYGLDRPIFHTEGALLCPEYNPADSTSPGAAFEEAQADYVVWLFVRNLANDVDVTTWYDFQGPGWRYGGLLDETQIPKPAFDALKFLTQELQDTSYVRTINDYDGINVRAYEFSRNDKKVWILWSWDESIHSVNLPSNAQKAYDKYGTEINIVADPSTARCTSKFPSDSKSAHGVH